MKWVDHETVSLSRSLHDLLHWSSLRSLLRTYEGSNCSKSTLNSKSQRPTVGEEGDSTVIVACMHKPGHQQLWCLTDAGGEDLWNLSQMNMIQLNRTEKNTKDYAKLTQKFQWKSFPPNQLHFIPSNPMILKVVQKLFSSKWSSVNSQQKKKGDRSYTTVWHCSNSFRTVSLPVHYDPVQAKDIAALSLYLQHTSFL